MLLRRADQCRYETDVLVYNDDSWDFGTPIEDGVPNPMTFTGSVWPVSVLDKGTVCCMEYIQSHNLRGAAP